MPNLKIVEVIHVLDDNTIDKAEQLMPDVDALLLDFGNPNLKVKVLGGTGNIHNWKISESIVGKSKILSWLAGVLRPENVVEAISTDQSYGLDLCSGVRTKGNLDMNKMVYFFNEVKNGCNWITIATDLPNFSKKNYTIKNIWSYLIMICRTLLIYFLK